MRLWPGLGHKPNRGSLKRFPDPQLDLRGRSEREGRGKRKEKNEKQEKKQRTETKERMNGKSTPVIHYWLRAGKLLPADRVWFVRTSRCSSK